MVWNESRITCCVLSLVLGAGAAKPALADVEQDTTPRPDTTLPVDKAPGTAPNAPAEPSPETKTPFMDSLTGGKIDLNLRFRYEFAEVGASGDSNAFTMRTRIGYTTERHGAVQAAIQFEDSRAADYDQYNAAGLNNQGGLSVIADPEDTELNQLWLDIDLAEAFSLDDGQKASARIGRQRIILDDSRFVGNVGWRNLEQTFDAGVLKLTPSENLELFYGYVTEVNRIFGPDSGRDFDSDSHLINATFKDPDFGTATGFAYLLDFENGAAFSSQTYGLRLTNKKDGLTLGYALSAAYQTDYGDNPTDYDALYLAAEGQLTSGNLFGGLGAEMLGSDDGVASFQTPLATGHKFNGFADAFLTTPAGGLRDYYALAGTKLPSPFKGKLTAFYHYFTSDDTSDELGWEFDLVASHKITDNLTGLVKYAYFDGRGLSDVERLSLQVELSF